MTYFKNGKVVIGISLIIGGIIMMLAWFFHSPGRDIGRPEFQALLNTNALLHPVVTPLPYGGIYHVRAQHRLGKKTETVYLTTHLDETEVTRLFDQRGLKVDLPGEGLRGQWVSILSTVSVIGLVVGSCYGSDEHRPRQKRPSSATAHRDFHGSGGNRRSQGRGAGDRGFPARPRKSISASAATCPKACC